MKSNQVFLGDGIVQNSRGQKGDIISHANFALQKLRHPILYLKENSVQYQKNAKEGLLERRIHLRPCWISKRQEDPQHKFEKLRFLIKG